MALLLFGKPASGLSAFEMAQAAQGLAELASVIRDYPLTYYMAQAHTRLADKDNVPLYKERM